MFQYKLYTIKEKEDLKSAQLQMIEDELFANKKTLEFTKSSRISKRNWVSGYFTRILPFLSISSFYLLIFV